MCMILHDRRRKVGKFDTEFIVNANSSSLKDLRKYVKGRKMSDDEFLQEALKNEKPGAL